MMVAELSEFAVWQLGQAIGSGCIVLWIDYFYDELISCTIAFCNTYYFKFDNRDKSFRSENYFYWSSVTNFITN